MKIVPYKGATVKEAKEILVEATADGRYAVTNTIDGDCTKIRVYFGFAGGETKTGEAKFYIDNIQLERGKGGADYNYIENGSFDCVSDGSPVGWTGETEIEDVTINSKARNAVKLSGGLPQYDSTHTLQDSVSSITRNIPLNGKKGEIYSLGGWFNGETVNNSINAELIQNLFGEGAPAFNDNRSAQIKATYSYTGKDENNANVTLTESFAVDFEKGVSGWQFAIKDFVLKGDISSIDITAIYKNNQNDALFAGLELTKNNSAVALSADNADGETATQPACASCGHLGCTMENCNCTAAADAECNCNDCHECECEGCEEFDCECDSCRNNGTCSSFQCARRSNIETLSTDGTVKTAETYDSERYMRSTESYSSDKNYVTDITDSDNISTSYDYNSNTGTLLKSKYRLNENTYIETNYTYNAMNYLSMASTAVTGLTDNAASIALSYIYDGDLVSTVSESDVIYSYLYNPWGQIQAISVDNATLVSYSYDIAEYRSRIAEINYPNGIKLQYSYDEKGNITEVDVINTGAQSTEVIYTYEYDSLGNLLSIADSETDRTVYYNDNGITVRESSGDCKIVYQSYTDSEGNAAELSNSVTLTSKSYDSSYNQASGETTEKSAVTTGTKTLGTQTVSDWFGRTASSSVMTKDPTDAETTSFTHISSSYQYCSYEQSQTGNLVSAFNNVVTGSSGNTINVNYAYSYDAIGRIHTANGAAYGYDEAGQLKTVTYSGGSESYNYDSNGNITSKTVSTSTQALGTQVVTDTFGYDNTSWEDRLISFNNQSIAYDAIGNPTSYLGAALTWRGRELTSYTKGNKQISYNYDVDGMRYKKTVKTNNVVTDVYDYIYSDGKLIAISHTAGAVTNSARFIYDENGEVKGFIFNDTAVYMYLKNLQGDITALVDENGNIIVTYTYDAWGTMNFTATSVQNATLAAKLYNVNPFTYRCYCYDDDIGMYYLQSRYYDPEICRFINADSTDYLGASGGMISYNLFAYCENDPVNCVDESGTVKKQNNLELYLKNNKHCNKTEWGNSKLRLVVSGNTIKISATFNFNGSLKNKKLESKKYKDQFLLGVSSIWKGNFRVFNYNITLTTTATSKWSGITVKMNNSYGISSTTRSMAGWKPTRVGKITMYKGIRNKKNYTASVFRYVSAHEFGHLLGVDDMDSYIQYYYGASIFDNKTKKVQNIDIEMILTAYIGEYFVTWI